MHIASFLLALIAAAATPAETQPPGEAVHPADVVDQEDATPDSAKWEFILRPYVWLPSNSFTIGTPDYVRSESVAFTDAVGQFDYGGLLFFEAHHAQWAVYIDGMFVRLLDDSREFGLPVTSDIRQAVVEAAAVKSLKWGRHRLDILGGARYFRLDTDVRVKYFRDYTSKYQWVEPIIGLRHQMELGGRFRYDWRLDVGSLGISGRTSWQFNAILHYDITDTYSISGGYRLLSIRYDDGADRYDSVLSGLLFGFSAKF